MVLFVVFFYILFPFIKSLFISIRIIIKKIIFQGKEFNEAERFHLKRELGDVLWYWVQGCTALGYTPQEVMEENINKLESRYPNGFEVSKSEIRQEGDI